MASYNTVITNEGAALLASVIANQGTLTFSEMRFSTTDYDGVEATLTVGTFGGVFITAAAAGSVVDATTIKVGAQFDNSGIVGDHPLYSIGIVGTDGNTTALIAVCTTTNPDIIRAALTGVSTYAFNVNLAVSSTSNITVTGTTAAVLYDTDVVDNLTSPATNKPLSANQGRLIGNNLAANENVYGAKNLITYPYEDTTKTDNGITFTDNGDGSVTVSGTASGNALFNLHDSIGNPYLENGEYTLSGCPQFGSTRQIMLYIVYSNPDDNTSIFINQYNTNEKTVFTINGSYGDTKGAKCALYILIESGTAITTPITFKPMICDARIIDPTFAPYAMTNREITNVLTAVDIPVSNDSLAADSATTIGLTGIEPSKMLSAMYINDNTAYNDYLLATFKVNQGSVILTIRNTNTTQTATIGGTIRVITR